MKYLITAFLMALLTGCGDTSNQIGGATYHLGDNKIVFYITNHPKDTVIEDTTYFVRYMINNMYSKGHIIEKLKTEKDSVVNILNIIKTKYKYYHQTAQQ